MVIKVFPKFQETLTDMQLDILQQSLREALF